MPRYEAEAKYIASIYPSELEIIRQYHGPDQDVDSSRCTVYSMPRVLRGQEPIVPDYKSKAAQNLARVQVTKIAGKWVAVMEVRDAFENVPDAQRVGLMQGGHNAFLARPIKCEDIANNLMTTWARSIPGLPTGAAPGLMIIAGTVPKQNEMEQMLSMQTMFYEFRLAEGDRLVNEKNFKGLSQQMRDAAIYLDRERSWSGAYGTVGTEECPECFEAVNPRATRCPHCRCVIVRTKAGRVGKADEITEADLEALTAPTKPQLEVTV